MILCDIGNTTYHFRYKDKQFKVNIDDHLDILDILDNGEFLKKKIYYISVNTKATKKFIKKFHNAIDIKDMITFKSNYQGLGVDREVVCSFINNAIIIDLGSAITVDIMQDNLHLGGFIIPGFKIFKKMYPNISRDLTFKFRNDIKLNEIPLNTQDAINYAILNAIILPIKKVQKEYNLPLIFTGGDGKQIIKYFEKYNYKYDEDLIFQSMKKIILQNKKIK